jgi:hypothetical protein
MQRDSVATVIWERWHSYLKNVFFVICARNIVRRHYLREAEIIILHIIAQENM